MTSAEEGGPTASPVAVCDRFNRRPKHRCNFVCQLSQERKFQWHRLNRRGQDAHRYIQRTMFQRRCQVPRSQVFNTGLTDGASEHSVGAMTSAEVGGPIASPGAVCDRFNRRPMHRFNRWSLESLQLCQEANGYFSCCE